MTRTDVKTTIREATRADYPALARVLSAAFPDHPVSAEGLASDFDFLRTSAQGPHVWEVVAEREGEVVACASVVQYPGMFHPDRYHAELAVHPQAERQGIGTALAVHVWAHLEARGAQEVLAGAYETRPHALRFLESRGFREVMRFFDNVLTLADFDPQPWEPQMRLPDGVRAVSLADLKGEIGDGAALHAFYGGFAEARADVPRTGEATELTFEDFRKRFDDLLAFPEGIFLAVTDAGEVVALSELWKADSGPHRLNIGLTGTRRAWRRRGLALALKLRGMALAQAQGVTEIWTGNATTNQPMLALNEKLGFRARPAFIEMKWGGV